MDKPDGEDESTLDIPIQENIARISIGHREHRRVTTSLINWLLTWESNPDGMQYACETGEVSVASASENSDS